MDDPGELARRLVTGDRRALAMAITLLESTSPDHRDAADELLAALTPRAGGALRLGLSGAPGVGKSTFIEALGRRAIGDGRRVAVLAVDPSSPTHGGSILGDKTRMPELARDPHAFVRPSPSGGMLGGVARRTGDAILAVEAAGFDLVIVETVGVGQSEIVVADLTDLFCLLLSPGAGDELQGLKKGIVERADLLIVNKADGEGAAPARATVADYQAALRVVRGAEAPEVLSCSGLTGEGVETVWARVLETSADRSASGAAAARRADQAARRFRAELYDAIFARLGADGRFEAMAGEIEAEVARGSLPPGVAARHLVERLTFGV